MVKAAEQNQSILRNSGVATDRIIPEDFPNSGMPCPEDRSLRDLANENRLWEGQVAKQAWSLRCHAGGGSEKDPGSTPGAVNAAYRLMIKVLA